MIAIVGALPRRGWLPIITAMRLDFAVTAGHRPRSMGASRPLACEDEDLILPGKVRKDFERLGHSVSWWAFDHLYREALGGREGANPRKE